MLDGTMRAKNDSPIWQTTLVSLHFLVLLTDKSDLKASEEQTTQFTWRTCVRARVYNYTSCEA